MLRLSKEIMSISEVIERADVVSFDIFDTLVCRPTLVPLDILRVPSYSTKKKTSDECVQIRIDAEHEARRLAVKRKSEEVSLGEIYHQIEKYLGKIDASRLMDEEIRLEIEASYPHNLLKYIYGLARDAEKRIVLVSDMYLPREVIECILRKCGYQDYGDLYLSSELNKTKASGSLWKYVKSVGKLQNNDVVHFGDNVRSDVRQPTRVGFRAVLVDTPKSSLYPKARILHSSKSLGALEHFVATCADSRKGLAYRLGYDVLGPLISGFCCWFHNRAVEQDIDKIAFLSRDGYIVERVYEKLFGDDCIPHTYLYVSRRALLLPSLHEELSLDLLIDSISLNTHFSVGYFLERVGICPEEVRLELNQLGYTAQTELQLGTVKRDPGFRRLYSLIQPRLKEMAEKEYVALRQYLENEDLPEKKIAVIDIGWYGSMQVALGRIFESISPNTKVYGYYTGMKGRLPTFTRASEGCCKEAEGFLFSPENNPSRIEIEDAFNGFYEVLMSAPSGSLRRYCIDGGGKLSFEFDDYEYSNQMMGKFLSEVRAGALDFAGSCTKYNLFQYVDLGSEPVFAALACVGLNPPKDLLSALRGSEMMDGESYILVSGYDTSFYLLHPRQFISDFKRSVWRPGLLKQACVTGIPWGKVYAIILSLAKYLCASGDRNGGR